MNSGRILAGEWVVAIAFTSYFAIKNKTWPWPRTVAKISASFAVFGIVGMAAPEIATALAAGFLLAGFLTIYQKGLKSYYGGVPMMPGPPPHPQYPGTLTIPLNSGGK